jgi:hypothetical protein
MLDRNTLRKCLDFVEGDYGFMLVNNLNDGRPRCRSENFRSSTKFQQRPATGAPARPNFATRRDRGRALGNGPGNGPPASLRVHVAPVAEPLGLRMISGPAAAAVAAAGALAGAACGAAAARRNPGSAARLQDPTSSSAVDGAADAPVAAAIAAATAAGGEFDAPGLENRVLRKAETVVRGRTGRFLIVVERCCNSHNYSAIIRTAEACVSQSSRSSLPSLRWLRCRAVVDHINFPLSERLLSWVSCQSMPTGSVCSTSG